MFRHVLRTQIKRPFIKQLDRTDGHYYETESGRIYPSITTVLKIETKDGIDAWRNQVGEIQADRIMRESQEAGTAMHKLIEHYLKNEEQPTIIQDTYGNPFAYDPYKLFEQIKPVLDEHVNSIHALETKLYSDDMGLAGTVDCVAEFDGKLSVIDFKNSRKKKTKSRVKNYFLQAAAYGNMWKECMNEDIEQGIIIISNWDDTHTIFKVNLVDHQDDLWKVLYKWETLNIYA